MYIPRHKGNRCWLQKSPEVYDYQEFIINSLINSNLNNIDKYAKLSLTLVFGVISNINNRDLDNMLKISIDGIFKGIGINDNRVNEINCKKVISSMDCEYISIKIDVLPTD
jgi:Holliday junction resolvase RusA-like endonuclease